MSAKPLPTRTLTPAGNLVGLALSPLLLAAYGWRGMFLVFGTHAWGAAPADVAAGVAGRATGRHT